MRLVYKVIFYFDKCEFCRMSGKRIRHSHESKKYEFFLQPYFLQKKNIYFPLLYELSREIETRQLLTANLKLDINT